MQVVIKLPAEEGQILKIYMKVAEEKSKQNSCGLGDWYSSLKHWIYGQRKDYCQEYSLYVRVEEYAQRYALLSQDKGLFARIKDYAPGKRTSTPGILSLLYGKVVRENLQGSAQITTMFFCEKSKFVMNLPFAAKINCWACTPSYSITVG